MDTIVQCSKLCEETVITEKERQLREQLRVEIEERSKLCANSSFECSIPRIEGHEYCIRHILQDTRSGYKQCNFIYQNGRKCLNAVPKLVGKRDPSFTTLCFEHSRYIQLVETRKRVGVMRSVDTNETMLNTLNVHLNVQEVTVKKMTYGQDEEIDVVSQNAPAFVNYQQINDLKDVNSAIKNRRRILDYASDSSSDKDLTVSSTSQNTVWDESDDASGDAQEVDSLKHSSIYTREEATVISENKLSKLQGLYINQINRLHHILKEKRRQYVQAMRKEREIFCSISDQARDTYEERMYYDELKAFNHFHRRYGMEAVLYKKFKDKRSRSTQGYFNKGPGILKCIYTEGGVKCGERCIPCTKFCKKHILEDKKQILFRACGVDKSGVVCQETIPCIFEDATCVLHMEIPQKEVYVRKKYDSETDDAEEGNEDYDDDADDVDDIDDMVDEDDDQSTSPGGVACKSSQSSGEQLQRLRRSTSTDRHGSHVHVRKIARKYQSRSSAPLAAIRNPRVHNRRVTKL